MKNHLEQQMEAFINTLPPATQNNSRSITRDHFRRIANMKDQKMAAYLFEKLYGFDCDYDDALSLEPHN